MSDIGKYNLSLLPITVTTQFGSIEGFLLQAPGTGKDFGIHPAAGTSMMHGSPLAKRLPFFLYQTADEVDEAVVSFLESRNTPIYFLDPTGEVEWSGHGPKIGYQWPDKDQKCDATVAFRPTMQKQG